MCVENTQSVEKDLKAQEKCRDILCTIAVQEIGA